MNTEATTATASAATEAKKPEGIALDFPIKRGATEITHVPLRKPSAGELRGVKLTELLQMDVGALQTVLPRITPLTQAEVQQLDPADLTELAGQVASFFVRRSIREEFASA